MDFFVHHLPLHSLIYTQHLSFLLSRNYVRFYDEFKKYNYNPLENPLYKVEKKHFRIEKIFFELISNFEKCEKSLNSCDSKNRARVKKFLKERYIFVVKHD